MPITSHRGRKHIVPLMSSKVLTSNSELQTEEEYAAQSRSEVMATFISSPSAQSTCEVIATCIHSLSAQSRSEVIATCIHSLSAQSRSEVIATYALCGFANLGSMGIQLGGLGAMAPSRRTDLSLLVLRAMITGCIVCFTTACIAGNVLSVSPPPVSPVTSCLNVSSVSPSPVSS